MTVIDEGLGIQDGPGWWLAREAIDWLVSGPGPSAQDAEGAESVEAQVTQDSDVVVSG